jgi:hypothetical protein
MEEYRTTHQMLGPCCFCPLVDVIGPDFVESAIHIVTMGPFVGEYAAMCACEKCGYFGESVKLSDHPVSHQYEQTVPIGRMYVRASLACKEYGLRCMF